MNPARLDLPKAEPVAEQDRLRFELERDAALGLLAGLPPDPARIAAGGGSRVVDGDTDD